MNPTRTKILLGLAVVLALALIWNWISGWGLVTVHVQGQEISKIIQSIERQGGIKIVTNAAPDTKITMDVDRVPPAEAVDVLAARLDANWTVGYVAGPTKADVTAGLTSFTDGGRNRDFRTFGFGGFGGFGGGGGMMEVSATPIDSRLVVWKVSVSDTPNLHSYLDQLSQKTGLMAAVPESWNPDIPKTPGGGKAASALRSIIKSVNGVYREVFVIRVNDFDRFAGNQGAQPAQRPGSDGNLGGPRPDGNADRGNGQRGGPGNFHPEWMQERAEARIAQLPAAEQPQAKKDFDEMRAMFEKMQALPDDQRRTAMENFFNSPAVQQRMADRMVERDEKSGPDKRAERSRRYIERKQQMKDAANTSS
ncbi:MAG: hypothetical protein ACREKL_04230 [Chthoniobacterales bacterium]